MKIIFLDIDGVLNCQSSKTRCGGFIGIDDRKAKILKVIVEKTGAKIVLCSSWKTGWERVDKECQDNMATYMDKKLRKQKLFILDKTDDNGEDRGHGICNWISNHNVEQWVVLDDEIFPDYEEMNIFSHLVKSSFYDDNGGLQDEHIDIAVKLLCE